MKPYIIINGKDSQTVKGLLIQDVPPVCKPKIRVKTETVDGRDGDINTVLGYSAYDKTFNIGLFGDYDIDAIIKYFATDGKITFSNEPDKFYNFNCYDSIDFERLIKFRTAKVALHVQPFKFSALEPFKSFTFSGNNNIIDIRNAGNIYARPIYELTASGSVSIRVNTADAVTITFPAEDAKYIIDTVSLNIYDANGNFKNRLATGDYNDLVLPVGANQVTINGAVSSLKIKDRSRWI